MIETRTKNNIFTIFKDTYFLHLVKRKKNIYFQTKFSGLACQITKQILEFLMFNTDTDVEKNTDANISFKRSQFEICNFQKKSTDNLFSVFNFF